MSSSILFSYLFELCFAYLLHNFLLCILVWMGNYILYLHRTLVFRFSLDLSCSSHLLLVDGYLLALIYRCKHCNSEVKSLPKTRKLVSGWPWARTQLLFLSGQTAFCCTLHPFSLFAYLFMTNIFHWKWSVHCELVLKIPLITLFDILINGLELEFPYSVYIQKKNLYSFFIWWKVPFSKMRNFYI